MNLSTAGRVQNIYVFRGQKKKFTVYQLSLVCTRNWEKQKYGKREFFNKFDFIFLMQFKNE